MFIQQERQNIVPTKIELPKIKIPKKSIQFTITKDKNSNIDFRGIFREAKTAKIIAKILNSRRLEHEIRINKELSNSDKITTLLLKIIKQLSNNNYIEWSIIYKDNKLLVSGKCKSKEYKERIESILTLSDINSFSNITIEPISEDLDVISNLKTIVESQKRRNTQATTEDEVNIILSNLKSLIIEEKPQNKKIIKKRVKRVKKVQHKKVHKTKKLKIIQKSKKVEKKKIVSKQNIKIVSQIKPKKDIDIMSLPFVKTVDMNIEEKIRKGEIPSPRTKKPLVKKKTVYIQSNEKPIDNNIPWAKLHNIDEKVDGIFIPEVINK
ncbi:MAG TPA: hypothetical protein ENK88_03965 [Campylobacterales bacterium]|nr:hypothetical protein [Campylobacterales bacterium]